MKVGIIGSQGTGKTTAIYQLGADLKKEGLDVFLLTEVARSCPFQINEATTRKSQLWIMGKLITREQSSKGQILIGDRTLLDVFAYSYRVDPEFFEPFKPFIKKYMETYDIVFYLFPNDRFLVDDGFRSTSKKFRDEIDKILKELINELNINVTFGINGAKELILEKMKKEQKY